MSGCPEANYFATVLGRLSRSNPPPPRRAGGSGRTKRLRKKRFAATVQRLTVHKNPTRWRPIGPGEIAWDRANQTRQAAAEFNAAIADAVLTISARRARLMPNTDGG